eukprot:3744632-Amphidinium_carterae.1
MSGIQFLSLPSLQLFCNTWRSRVSVVLGFGGMRDGTLTRGVLCALWAVLLPKRGGPWLALTGGLCQ